MSDLLCAVDHTLENLLLVTLVETLGGLAEFASGIEGSDGDLAILNSSIVAVQAVGCRLVELWRRDKECRRKAMLRPLGLASTTRGCRGILG